MSPPNIVLDPFQVPAYEKLVAQKRHLLLAKMGRGKTFVSVKAMYDVQVRTVLIVCPKNAIRVWEDHINRIVAGLDDDCGKDTWYAVHRYKGKYNNTAKRQEIARRFNKECHLNVWITTYDSFIRDFEIYSRRTYQLVIIDEAKRMRNRKSKSFLALKPVCKDAKYVWPLTGAPGNTPEDFFTMFHLLDPKYFSSFHKYMQIFCYWQRLPWGGTEYLGLKNKEAWYQLQDRKVSWMRGSHMDDKPIRRQILEIPLDDEQERLYKEIDEHMIAFSGDELIIAQTDMTKVLRFRQIMCCPKILDPNASIGAAFADYVETIKNDTDPNTVVFTPFTEAIPHFKQCLNANGFNNVEVLSGGLEPDELERRIDRFRRTRGQLICSIMYATAFSLEPATECFFVGYEWDPEDNEQAEHRLFRLTTKEQITAYYYAHTDTYTTQHLELLTTKQRNKQETHGLLRPTKI